MAAEPLPLSAPFWREPAFLKAFTGSYEIESRIEPTVTSAESEILVQVQKLMATEKRAEALRLLEQSALLPNSAALQFNRGNLLFEEGKLENAITAYEAAIKMYPSFRRAHRNLALSILRKDSVSKALPPLLEAIRLGDQDGLTYGLLGYCRLQEERWASALQAYRMALLMEPDSVEWKSGLAQCLQHLDQDEEAVALLDEVIEARPDQASYAMVQAGIYMSMDRHESAIAALDLPRRLGTLDGEGLLLLAELHLRAGREHLSIPLVTAAFARSPLPPPARILATLRSATNLAAWPLARDLEKQAFLHAPADSSAYRVDLLREQARIDLASGENVERGLKTLRELVAARPDDGASLVILGQQLAKTGAGEEAELLFLRAAKSEEAAFEAWFELVRLRVEQRRYEAAIAALDNALGIRKSEDLSRYREALAGLIDAAK
ncbi:MAG: Tetratricopeptide (TPR) repeat [Verrucomicrobia bacterium]|jgi:tetratricopeptide (TPR) repeat protein|nr:MAG: Tetratricopeptide (TPR) repeat [Verrucomicrobiota bacterium]